MRKKVFVPCLILLLAGCASVAPPKFDSSNRNFDLGRFVGSCGTVDQKACADYLYAKSAVDYEKAKSEARKSELRMIPRLLPGGMHWGIISGVINQ